MICLSKIITGIKTSCTLFHKFRDLITQSDVKGKWQLNLRSKNNEKETARDT